MRPPPQVQHTGMDGGPAYHKLIIMPHGHTRGRGGDEQLASRYKLRGVIKDLVNGDPGPLVAKELDGHGSGGKLTVLKQERLLGDLHGGLPAPRGDLDLGRDRGGGVEGRFEVIQRLFRRCRWVDLV